ncbi:unnamed protein product [Prorocentrum cordatum]|uniref:Uncharacterized protein n=1 Tax=Prorocentrum cordatum TaxID=2364126 RepID=A0ABN9WC23_9DINO|nr:unnamed protein product [Polarella glacialis]
MAKRFDIFTPAPRDKITTPDNAECQTPRAPQSFGDGLWSAESRGPMRGRPLLRPGEAAQAPAGAKAPEAAALVPTGAQVTVAELRRAHAAEINKLADELSKIASQSAQSLALRDSQVDAVRKEASLTKEELAQKRKELEEAAADVRVLREQLAAERGRARGSESVAELRAFHAEELSRNAEILSEYDAELNQARQQALQARMQVETAREDEAARWRQRLHDAEAALQASSAGSLRRGVPAGRAAAAQGLWPAASDGERPARIEAARGAPGRRRMASGDAGCDAALAAWAAACLGQDQPPRALEDLAEGSLLLSLARRFVRGAEAELPKAFARPRDCRVEIAGHINEAYRTQQGRTARIVDVRWAGRGDARAVRVLLLGVLLAAFQGPRAQEAAAHVGALPEVHQGELAAAMQRALAGAEQGSDAEGAGEPAGAESGEEVGPCDSVSSRGSRQRDSVVDGGAQEELQELAEELDKRRTRCLSEKQASLRLVREIYAAKERLHIEADTVHELQDEFESQQQEAMDTQRSMRYLHEEVQEETRVAKAHARRHGLAQQKVERLELECRTCDNECCELREQLARTVSGEKAAPKMSWGVVQRAKLKRMQEHQVSVDRRLDHVNLVGAEEEMSVQRLAAELQQLRENLREFDSEAAEERARLQETEALICNAEDQEDMHGRHMRRLAGASTAELLGELELRRQEEEQARRQARLGEARVRALQSESEEGYRPAPPPAHPADLAAADDEPGCSDGASEDAALGELRAALAGAEAEARSLREEVREAERGLAEASRQVASAGRSEEGPGSPQGARPLDQDHPTGSADPAAGAGAPAPLAALPGRRDKPRPGDATGLLGAAPAGAPLVAAARQVRGPPGGGGARGTGGSRGGVAARGAQRGSARPACRAVGLTVPGRGRGRMSPPRCSSCSMLGEEGGCLRVETASRPWASTFRTFLLVPPPSANPRPIPFLFSSSS